MSQLKIIPKNQLTILIPAYNEAWRIGPMLAEIELFIKKHPNVVHEVVLLDDGSKDATVERATYFMSRLPLRIERLVQNSGKWSAIRQGIYVADTDAILLLDADGSASIFELDSVFPLNKLLEQKLIIWGTRFAKDSMVQGKSFSRQVISQGYRLYVQFCFWLARGRLSRVQDMQCPFKLFYKSTMVRELVAERYSGDIDLALALKGGILNFPLNFVHKAGGSIKFKTVFQMFWETLRVVRFQRKFDKLRYVHYDMPDESQKNI